MQSLRTRSRVPLPLNIFMISDVLLRVSFLKTMLALLVVVIAGCNQ
jgi:hypothetical protein